MNQKEDVSWEYQEFVRDLLYFNERITKVEFREGGCDINGRELPCGWSLNVEQYGHHIYIFGDCLIDD